MYAFAVPVGKILMLPAGNLPINKSFGQDPSDNPPGVG